MTKRITIVFLLFVLAISALAQQKRPLTHDDYDQWEAISSTKITTNGLWVGYEVNPQEGDGRIEVVSHDDPSLVIKVPRGTDFNFSNDGNWAIGKIKAESDTVRFLKLRGKGSKEFPKDSLFILHLETSALEKFPEIKSYQLPRKKAGWMAIHFYPEKDIKDSIASDSTEQVKKQKKLKTDGTKLVVRNFDGSIVYEFDRVDRYGFSEEGNLLYMVNAKQDTLNNAGISLLNLESGREIVVDSGKTKYANVAFSKDLKKFAFIASSDSAKAEKPYFQLFLFDIKKGTKQEIVNKDTKGILSESRIAENGRLQFSDNSERLFFSLREDYKAYAYEEDTTILDEERVALDIWSWGDKDIQPMQLKNKSKEESKAYLAVYELKSAKMLQLADRRLDNINLDSKAKQDKAIITDDHPYRINYSWDIQIGRDIYLVDIKTGTRKLIVENASGYPSLSPEGKYVNWYSYRDSAWLAYDIAENKLINLTDGVQGEFYDQLHDSPSMPGSYGTAGWLENDEAVIVYDQYDIWKIDPKSKQSPVCLTKGLGKRNNIVFRREALDHEKEYIDPKAPFVLSAFNDINKRSGYFLGDIKGNEEPEELIYSDHSYFGLDKAKNTDDIILRRSTFQEYPDVYASNLDRFDLVQLSDANPQQENIKWGTVELTEYMTLKGDSLQGLIYKPENFDTNKQYPMMVYFYERRSNSLHNYIAPAPSASIINISYFVSNGYVVFVPDIKYEIGLPGPSAYDCVVPGVQSVIAKGYVDPENIAIQGQSWGGYQVAYLITQTDMFKAAGAGAPVANMTSAYGGIRWGSGMSRMFQYEQTQSRIGGTLWEKPMHYVENSPLFYADRVKTPVLIMHNDADGAVPWYQGIEFFMSLKRNRTPAWLLVYNGEDHNLRKRKNRKDLSIRLSQFFDHYLKGAPAPLWMTEGIPAVEKGKTLKYELSESE
ncbi:prolyl oligopeptidase family serine peptidase [Echinicola marina]|uniref:S9 family peptidase n=1 Tax=Echinicola marina TaxID=2859768 RepID=UPI001CF6BE0B|nr:prolyl oligopeptidase family serine peptidase [Echinicola marina]UCS92881.1 prolyl oligopeptidase family serine peptidase [Echinicola marina]